MYDYLIIYAVNQLKGQRSTASIYHIISGRKSAQTIQDAHIYQMTQLYSIYPQLKRADFEKSIIRLTEANLIHVADQEIASLTSQGSRSLNDQQGDYPINHLKGMEYASITSDLSERLFLTIQTYANLSMANHSFQPISDRLSVQKWVKRFYAQNQSIETWLATAYEYLEKFLSEIDEQQAQIFVDRLTGYRKYGLSIQQLALKYNLSTDDVYLRLTGCYHQLISFIEKNKITFLKEFIPEDDHNLNQFMTQSALKTYQFISKGFSMEKTMQLRRLKRSTIEDHIVELTYAIPEFDLLPYIDQAGLNDIWSKIEEIDDHRLAKIKKLLGDQYSYFQIRLAMAKARLKRD